MAASIRKMKLVTYIQETVNPGGTPKRYLQWVSIVLICQVMAAILPSEAFYNGFNYAHTIFIAVITIAIAANFVKSDRQKILAAYSLYIVGLALTALTIASGLTSISGMVFMLTWAMTLFISERREYISFDLVTLFMVLMLISTVLIFLYSPAMGRNDNFIILATGGLLTAVDIYLVYVDFGYEKNYYQESRRTYANLERLSAKLSDILSTEGQLDHLLWQVTQECVPFLELDECVIYLYDEEKQRLVQLAAYGGKSNEGKEIINPIEIDPDKGIVGKCFTTGKTMLVKETKYHPEYIVDDEERNSELAVPILSNGKVIGVIDSEHRIKGFFKERHVQAFQIMAAFCGIKIMEYYAKESIQQAQIAQARADRYKELDELKNRFITNISHDLKTPLSLIKAPAMQIASTTKNAQVKKHSNYILKNTEHLLRVVNQLLQLNRVDKGLNELYLEEVDVEKLISKIAAQYKGLAEKDNVKFEVHSDAPAIFTDSFRLEQIIHNLVHNAFRYTGKKGTISLRVTHHEDMLIIDVADNGPGIPSALQPKIFDRFFKADENNHEGTGIGLSLVKEYASSLGGKVKLESEEGHGTRFNVVIPMVKHEPDQALADDWEEIELASGGKPVMLVVEDHADLNDFICSFFEKDFRCISAFEGKEALAKMEHQIPDIIISDLMMPNMDGNTFVQHIRENDQLSHIPIIVLSAKAQTESRIDLYEIGADNYLVKPFDIQELSAVVHNVLEQRKKIKDLFRESFLVKPTSPSVASPEKIAAPLVSQALDYLMGQLDNSSLSVKDLAGAIGVGRNRLQKEIKDATSLTPVEFMRSIRLNEAKKMLCDSSMNISEVAYAVGFNNLSYFTRSFKNEFDTLPSEWQEQQIGIQPSS